MFLPPDLKGSTMNNIRRVLLLAVCLGTASVTTAVSAQGYPRKAVAIVVPFSAGAGTDQIARILAERLSPRIGQPVVVENRVGAAGILGTTYVAKAAADGHTLLFTPGSIAFAQQVLKTAPAEGYDALNGFTPIIEVGKTPVFLVTGASSGFTTFNGAAAAAKTRKLHYGSAGHGSILHIVGEVVNKATGAGFVHVPYKGVAPAIADVLGGHIPLGYGSLSTIKPHIAGGKLVVLAVTSRERTPLAPEVPTLNELGYKSVDINSWYGIFGPKGMPEEVVKTLNQHLNELLKMPDVVERMAAQGATPVGGAPGVLAKTNSTDFEVIGNIIKELGITSN